MADTKTYTTNYNLTKPGQDDFYNVDDFNGNADKVDVELKAAADRDAAHKNAATLDHPDNSVTDAKIGNRTANQNATIASTLTGSITQLFSMVFTRIKQMLGTTNFYDAVPTTLTAAKAHADAAAPHSGHETPAGAQAKATAAQTAANTYTDNKTANLVNTSDVRLTNARPANGGTSSFTDRVNAMTGNAAYRMAYAADGVVQNPGGSWGKAVMVNDSNGQTYGMRVDRADYAESAGSVAGIVANGKQVFTASGTFTVPAGVTKVYVSMCGGGGGGCGINGSGTYGNPGGASSFGSYVSTPGGGGGGPYSSVGTSGGAGGQHGQAGAVGTNGWAGAGGSSLFGAGGGYCSPGGGGYCGNDAQGYGAGGGGTAGGNNYGGAGGGAAACVLLTPVTVTPGQQIAVTIGGAGAGGGGNPNPSGDTGKGSPGICIVEW